MRGQDVRGIDAVIISHDHSDHSRAMGIYQRKFGLPVYVTAKTLHAARTSGNLGDMDNVRHFQAGAALRFGTLIVETIPTPHDGADGVAFVVDDGKRRLGILTDLGHVFDGLEAVIRSLDAALLESNYDPEMLANGPYPEWLQRRVRGPKGHLSNIEAAELLLAAASKRMKWVCLGHLSHNNNTPELAVKTHRRVWGKRWPVHVATRYEPTDVLEI